MAASCSIIPVATATVDNRVRVVAISCACVKAASRSVPVVCTSSVVSAVWRWRLAAKRDSTKPGSVTTKINAMSRALKLNSGDEPIKFIIVPEKYKENVT